MQNITLRSRVGADGNLQLNIPTALPNMELDVLIFLHPIIRSSEPNKPKTFSERWQGKFICKPNKHYLKTKMEFEKVK